jgi:CAAX protease family protein
MLRELVRNPYCRAYLGTYALTLLALYLVEGFGLLLPLFVLLVMGGLFSLIAMWVSKRAIGAPLPVRSPGPESLTLALYLTVVVGWFLTGGMGWLRASFDPGQTRTVAVLVAKVVVFVLMPYALIGGIWRYGPRDLATGSFDLRRHGRVVLGMLAFILPYQAIVGQGVGQLRQAGFEAWQVGVGAIFSFAWLVVEVGLVEEFPYRVLLQSRLTTLCRSEIAGVLLMALLFGLTHAPGLYLRTAASLEGLGESPSLLAALGYSVVVISPAGIFLGVLWARTRNLWVVMLVHAGFDWLPQVTDLTRTFFSR